MGWVGLRRSIQDMWLTLSARPLDAAFSIPAGVLPTVRRRPASASPNSHVFCRFPGSLQVTVGHLLNPALDLFSVERVFPGFSHTNKLGTAPSAATSVENTRLHGPGWAFSDPRLIHQTAGLIRRKRDFGGINLVIRWLGASFSTASAADARDHPPFARARILDP